MCRVADELGVGRCGGGDDGCAAIQRVKDSVRESFVAGIQRQIVGGAEIVRETLMWDVPQKSDTLINLAFGGTKFQRSKLRAIPRHDEMNIRYLYKCINQGINAFPGGQARRCNYIATCL